MIIALGSKVRDKITGFEGISTTRSSHITGCDTYWVTPGLDRDGKPGDMQSFDENRLTILKDTPIQVQTGTVSAG